MPNLTVGMVTRLDAAWDLGASVVSADTVTLTEWSTGAARYWTGAAWTSTPTTLAVPQTVTVPSAWLGLEVGVLYTWAAYPELTAEPIVVVPESATVNVTPDVRTT